MSQILEGLTESQREAVTTINGPLLVLAGAGSGKTRVITKRIAYMIEQGISPGSILAITFTNKAAGEMVERVSDLISGPKPLVSTFHSFCARVLRSEAIHAGLEQNFVIYDTNDSLSVIRGILKDTRSNNQKSEPNKVYREISRLKNELMGPNDIKSTNPELSLTYAAYQSQLLANNAADFDDLLLLVLKIFASNNEVLLKYREKYTHLLVDEFQDTNVPQNEMIKLLAGPIPNLCVTGDPDQTIYSWRGAKITNIMNFQKLLPQAKVVKLEENFRSTNIILKAANAVIKNNSTRYDKDLFSALGEGEQIKLSQADDEGQEAQRIANTIANLRGNGCPLKQIAVFYRTNGQSRSIEEAMRLSGIPYTIVGSIKFYDRAEIKDLLAYLRLMVNGKDNISLLRAINTPSRGVGVKALETIKEMAIKNQVCLAEALTLDETQNSLSKQARKGVEEFLGIFAAVYEKKDAPIAEILEIIFKKSGYKKFIDDDEKKEDRLSNIESLFNAAAEHQKNKDDASISSFLEAITLVSDVDSWDDKEERVTMMTIHSAKGLEFDAVFIAGLEENILPHRNGLEGEDPEAGLEEERRIFYVGITRARKNLYFSHVKRRYQWGNAIYAAKSRFLKEIPETLFASSSSFTGPKPVSGFSLRNAWEKKRQQADDDFNQDSYDPSEESQIPYVELHISASDIVKHFQYGKGVVMKIDGKGPEAIITVVFEGGMGVKKLKAAYAKLVKV